jgi:hypothetical protein
MKRTTRGVEAMRSRRRTDSTEECRHHHSRATGPSLPLDTSPGTHPQAFRRGLQGPAHRGRVSNTVARAARASPYSWSGSTLACCHPVSSWRRAHLLWRTLDGRQCRDLRKRGVDLAPRSPRTRAWILPQLRRAPQESCSRRNCRHSRESCHIHPSPLLYLAICSAAWPTALCDPSTTTNSPRDSRCGGTRTRLETAKARANGGKTGRRGGGVGGTLE